MSMDQEKNFSFVYLNVSDIIIHNIVLLQLEMINAFRAIPKLFVGYIKQYLLCITARNTAIIYSFLVIPWYNAIWSHVEIS